MTFPNPDIIYIIDVGARFIVPNGLGFDKSNPYIDNNSIISSFLEECPHLYPPPK